MRNPGGYATWTGPSGLLREADTFTCCHCNGVVFVGVVLINQPEPDRGGWCRKCNAGVCGRCADAGVCRPFEKWLDQMEGKIKQRLDQEAAERAYERALKATG